MIGHYRSDGHKDWGSAVESPCLHAERGNVSLFADYSSSIFTVDDQLLARFERLSLLALCTTSHGSLGRIRMGRFCGCTEPFFGALLLRRRRQDNDRRRTLCAAHAIAFAKGAYRTGGWTDAGLSGKKPVIFICYHKVILLSV